MSSCRKVLFICKENVCRSIMAEAILQCGKGRPAAYGRFPWGLVVLFPEPLNPKAVAVLKGNEMEPSKEYSEEFVPEVDVTEGTLILTMSEQEKKQVLKSARRFGAPAEVYTLGEYAGRKDGRKQSLRRYIGRLRGILRVY